LIVVEAMESGEHVSLPTYVNYKFNIAVGLDVSFPGFDQLYGLALSTAPPDKDLTLCNGKSNR